MARKRKRRKKPTNKVESNKEEIKQKKEKPKNETKLTPKAQKKENKQIMIVFLAIIALFLAFLIPYFYFQSQKVFKYQGLTWQIEKDGEVTFYHTQFNKTIQGKYLGKQNTFLRNDPRKNNIEINVSNFSFYKNIIISTSPEALKCDKEILVTDALYQITLAMPYYDKIVKTAVTDKDLANKTNQDYRTCLNKPVKSTVIQIELGNESKITQEYDNGCYKLTLKSCEDNFQVSEKFILEIIKVLSGN